MEEVKLINVKDDDFEDKVLKSEVPVVVDFWAPWCGSCRQVFPLLEKMAQMYKGRLKVCKLDVVEGQQTATKYVVMSIPTLKIFKGGEMVDQIVGITPSYESDIKEKVELYI